MRTSVLERLRITLTSGCDAIRQTISGLAGDLRVIGENLVAADNKGAQQCNIRFPDTVLHLGVTRRAPRVVAFSSDQIRSVAITDRDKTVLGVGFPALSRDGKKGLVLHPGIAESEFNKYTEFPAPIGGEPLPTRNSGLKMRPTPWANEKQGRILFTYAHADGVHGYLIQVRRKIPLTRWSIWTQVMVDGGTFGRILASNSHFKKAAITHPVAEVVQISCSAAKGVHARESAEALHSAEIGFPVHAAQNGMIAIGFAEPTAPPTDQTPSRLKRRLGEIDTLGVVVPSEGENMTFRSPWATYRPRHHQSETHG